LPSLGLRQFLLVLLLQLGLGFERRTSTESGLFALLRCDFEEIFGQIVSIRIKTLGNTNMVASMLIKREKGSVPVDVRCSKTSLLKFPNDIQVILSRI